MSLHSSAQIIHTTSKQNKQNKIAFSEAAAGKKKNVQETQAETSGPDSFGSSYPTACLLFSGANSPAYPLWRISTELLWKGNKMQKNAPSPTSIPLLTRAACYAGDGRNKAN